MADALTHRYELGTPNHTTAKPASFFALARFPRTNHPRCDQRRMTDGIGKSVTVASEHFSLTKPLPLSNIRAAGLIRTNALIFLIAHIENAVTGALCFCDRPPKKVIDATDAFILVPSRMYDELKSYFRSNVLIPVQDARAMFIDIVQELLIGGAIEATNAIPRPFGVHPSVSIGSNCYVHPETLIEEAVTIGSNCSIHSGSWIKAGTTIRENSVIGTTGINAYVGRDGKRRGFPHLAGTIVGRGAEIGAGCVVVRGILSSTQIGDECIIGNLCNIGHGVEVGRNGWMSVGALIGGHAKIGEKATLGMGVAVRDNVTIGRGAQVGMGSIVVKDVPEGRSLFGNPARTVAALQAGPPR